MKIFRSDLHVHTVLSPCAEVEMIPPLIVEAALDFGLDLIAITDHNSSANIQAVQKAAEGTGLFVLPGMELQTKEDIHSLCLFDSIDQINEFQKKVDLSLPNILNQPEFFGEQFIVDETGEFIRHENKMLITSSSLSLDAAWKIVTEMGGLFIPAHINRPTFGLISSLGFVPPNIPFTALEISRHVSPEETRKVIPSTGKTPFIQSGDVHRLDDFLGSLYLTIENPLITELIYALGCNFGRFSEILI